MKEEEKKLDLLFFIISFDGCIRFFKIVSGHRVGQIERFNVVTY
jgi:hypothetical protein